jgi:hypothetical protein
MRLDAILTAGGFLQDKELSQLSVFTFVNQNITGLLKYYSHIEISQFSKSDVKDTIYY